MAIRTYDLLTPDSYINEISEWVDKIYEITEEDYVHGGESGYSNVPHEQLSNRTLYLKDSLESLKEVVNALKEDVTTHKNSNLTDFSQVRATIQSLSNSLTALNNIITSNDENTQKTLNDLQESLSELQNDFETMEYRYAASDQESGDALTVSTQKVYNTELSLIGVSSTEPNKLKYNDAITIERNTIKATTFKGNLQGEAQSAKKFTNKLNFTLYGDISGSVSFDGSEEVKLETNITPNPDGTVPTGTYGPGMDVIINPGESFYVPEFTVSKTGLITKIVNRELTLTLDPDVLNRTVNNDATNDKILLLGAPNQGTRQRTYSNAAVFERNGILYSRYNEVVDVESEQSLNNKTVNGYKIKEAAGREVDDTIGGVIGSNKLITSNALAQHSHNYADGDEGRAKTIVLNDNSNTTGFIVTNSEDNKVGIDRNISVSAGKITAKNINIDNMYATQSAHIPGGKIWIEQVSGSGIIGITPDIEYVLGELNALKRIFANLDTDTIHIGKMYKKQTCTEMQLLSYNNDSYRLADNRNEILSANLVLSLTPSDINHDVHVLTYGIYLLPTDEYDGCSCYVGQDGNVMFERPYEEDLVIKKVGYVAGNKFIFRPEDSNIDYVVSIENKVWEYDIQGNLMPSNAARAHDAIWEKDVQGDFMPCKGDFSNDSWESTLDGLVPVGEGIVVENDTWGLDSEGNITPFAQGFAWDRIWEVDEYLDLMTSENDDINDIWESIGNEIKPTE